VNEAIPIERLAFQWRRRETGSISAPARKVRVTEPRLARKVVNAVCCTRPDTPGMLPATAPTRISASATAIPARMLISEAPSASAIQMAATV